MYNAFPNYLCEYTDVLASLPWYDGPAQRSELDRFWMRLRERLQEETGLTLPRQLNRSMPYSEQWLSPELLLSQCCGPDLFTKNQENLVPIGRPFFAGLDCEPGNCFSYIVACGEVLEQPRIGVNSLTSFSGCTALLQWLDERGLKPAAVEITGSHEASLGLLREGRIDLAAIDANSWGLLDKGGVGILDRSVEAPAPPFVQGRGSVVGVEVMFGALGGALEVETVVGVGGIVGVVGGDYFDLAELNEGLLGRFGLGSEVAGLILKLA